MAGKHEWEIIESEPGHVTARMLVPGGWLYRYSWTMPNSEEGTEDEFNQIAFVPMVYDTQGG
jgi:hypothetical protein